MLASLEKYFLIRTIYDCSETMSRYRRDQKICCQGLRLLVALVPHLNNQQVFDSSLQAAREIAARMRTAFW